MKKNNNPLCVKQASPKSWKGSIGTDDRSHAIFADPVFGIRAAIRTLQSKWLNGKQNLIQIISDWAPANDTQGSIPGNPQNDPLDYAGFVSNFCGKSVITKLPEPSEDPLLWLNVVRAMSKFEMGEYCPWSILVRGMAMWYEDFISQIR